MRGRSWVVSIVHDGDRSYLRFWRFSWVAPPRGTRYSKAWTSLIDTLAGYEKACTYNTDVVIQVLRLASKATNDFSSAFSNKTPKYFTLKTSIVLEICDIFCSLSKYLYFDSPGHQGL
jgi:hypothetical protein